MEIRFGRVFLNYAYLTGERRDAPSFLADATCGDGTEIKCLIRAGL